MATVDTASKAPGAVPDVTAVQTGAAGNAVAFAVPGVSADLARGLDVRRPETVIHFGAEAQKGLREISGQIVEGVRAKDAGPAGDALNGIVLALRGFDLSDMAGEQVPGWFLRLLGAAHPVAKALQRYETVKSQIAAFESRLSQHKQELLNDVMSLERLYDAAVSYRQQTDSYIEAAVGVLENARKELETLRAKAAQTDDPADAQEASRFESGCNDLERRIYDLRLGRSIAVQQAIPAIAVIQSNDKTLAEKIDSVLANTLPLWEYQVAQAITLHRSYEAAKTVRSANDLTNELIRRNADFLRETNRIVRQEVERGVVDVETIKHITDQTIATIADSQAAY